MVTNKKNTSVLQDGKAVLLAFTPAFLTGTVAAYVPIEGGFVMPVLAFLIAAVFYGLVVLWWQAETDRHRLPVPRPPRLDAGGPANVLRELARAAGEQDGAVDLRPRAPAKPALSLISNTPPAPAGFPEPCLLPSFRKPSPEEAGRTRLVAQAFEADRIELHLQPVVALPQRKIRFYEALTRLRLADGTLLAPQEFLPLLECLGRAPDFDRRILNRAMAVARHLVARGSEAIVTVNLSAHSVAEPGFLWSLVGPMGAATDILGRIVLELPQHCWRHLDADQRTALTALRDRGVPLSLDRAADLRFDPRSLSDLGLRFMKLPAELMIAAAAQDDGRHAGPDLHVRDFASALRRQGIRLVAERVEQEEMVPVLSDLGVPLAQGFVLSPPRPIRAEALGEQAPEPATGEETAPTLLRRAG